MPQPSPAPKEVRSRDADRSRLAILSAAREEFARYGLAGARVDRIAAQADLNKRLIYYYFGSKDALFLAVLEDAYADIRGAEQQERLSDMPPAQAIRRLTEFTWNYYLEHPEFLSLLNSENLEHGRHLAQSSRARATNLPLIETLANILERGRREGVFRGGVDAVQLYVTMAGMAYFYLNNRHTLSAIFGRDLMKPRALNERLSHMNDVVLSYVLKT